MKKLMILLLTLVLLLSACAQSGTVPTQPSEEAYPMTLTDMAGRTVTLNAKPEKLVSGYYISTSALIALGLEDNLVGVEAKADKRAIYRLSAPQLMDLPSVGTAKEFDLEGCIALQPDLVILPLKLKEAAAKLEELGIPALLVNPESRQQLSQMITLLAAATGCPDRGQALLDFTSQQADALENAWKADSTVRPTVYMAGNSGLLSTAGGKMYQNDLITLGGGTNVAAALENTGWAEIDYEQLLLWNPDCILLASDAGYSVEDVLSDPNLQSLKAVETKRVYKLPSHIEAWDSPVPGTILGSVWLAGMLHPERSDLPGADALIQEFYRTFYGFTYEN